MTHLIKRLGIHELVTRRDLSIAQVGRAWDACEAARQANSALLGDRRICLEYRIFGLLSQYGHDRDGALEKYRADLDRQIWRHLLGATQLGALMGSTQRAAFERQLDKEVPHATLTNIEATFVSMLERTDEIFTQTVFDLFERLHPRYASNGTFGFGKKMIFSEAIDYMGFGARVEDIMMDLSTILFRLDGKPAPTRATGIFALVKQAYRSDTRFGPIPDEVSTEYVRVKWFKNRNVHVWVLREDLLARMNSLLEEGAPRALASR